jgi:hypothetical protein
LKLDLIKKRKKDCMVGFHETVEKDGMIVKPENRVDDKKEKNVEVIRHVDLQKACVLHLKERRRVVNVLNGKRENRKD